MLIQPLPPNPAVVRVAKPDRDAGVAEHEAQQQKLRRVHQQESDTSHGDSWKDSQQEHEEGKEGQDPTGTETEETNVPNSTAQHHILDYRA
jgi:hypothetical protein